MKCECECHCGGIPSRDAMNDRLYWVEVLTGVYLGDKFTAWRDCSGDKPPWLVSVKGHSAHLSYADEEIRIIHEIIPED